MEALERKQAGDPLAGLEFVSNFEMLYRQLSSISPAVKQAK